MLPQLSHGLVLWVKWCNGYNPRWSEGSQPVSRDFKKENQLVRLLVVGKISRQIAKSVSMVRGTL